MRLRSHTVVFDSEPEFDQVRADPSGVVMRILYIWLADPLPATPVIRAYLGSVRYASGWYSRWELLRLFRRTSEFARKHGANGALLRRSLSQFLREYFRLRQRDRASVSRVG